MSDIAPFSNIPDIDRLDLMYGFSYVPYLVPVTKEVQVIEVKRRRFLPDKITSLTEYHLDHIEI